MTVYHLKYRPTKIADLDLSKVALSLKNILKSKEIPQSFLFSGPKGSGKTSAARILARAVNCLKLDNGEPCGDCPNCRSILQGQAMDIVEIDAASNRGIEDAKELKSKAFLLPSQLKYKVFIIDEAHMMTREAFNALLKLIEEPPKHTLFILCTTDEEKIPETILSRLIKIAFYKGDREELIKSVKRVVEGEGLKMEKEAIEEFIKRSDGSFRNLQKLLNETVIEYGKKIDSEMVINFFDKRVGDYRMEDMEKDLYGQDTRRIINRLELLAQSGVNFKKLREEIIEYFQRKMMIVLGVDKGESMLNLTQLEKWLQLLILAGKQEKEVYIDQLPLQLAVIDFIRPMENGEPEKLEDVKKNTDKSDEERPKRQKLDIKIEEVEEGWGRFMTMVKPYNHAVEAFLRAGRPTAIKGSDLVVEVYYPFHKEKLEEPKNRKIVEEVLKEVYGAEMGFVCVLVTGSKPPIVIKNDTPNSVAVNGENPVPNNNTDIYDVAKEIFG